MGSALCGPLAVVAPLKQLLELRWGLRGRGIQSHSQTRQRLATAVTNADALSSLHHNGGRCASAAGSKDAGGAHTALCHTGSTMLSDCGTERPCFTRHLAPGASAPECCGCHACAALPLAGRCASPWAGAGWTEEATLPRGTHLLLDEVLPLEGGLPGNVPPEPAGV